MTSTHHQSGSDRIFEALGRLDPDGRIETVVNLQGDLPTVERRQWRPPFGRWQQAWRISARLPSEITDEHEKTDPNVTKVVGSPIGQNRLRALYFTRATAPWGDGPLYHHVGIYAYRRAALARFVALAPSPLETRERLEQLRALEAGMRIDVEIVRAAPLGVDTPRDLERARDILSKGKGFHDEQDQQDRLPGRTGRQFRHGMPRHVSKHGAPALPDLRGRVQRGWRRARPIWR